MSVCDTSYGHVRCGISISYHMEHTMFLISAREYSDKNLEFSLGIFIIFHVISANRTTDVLFISLYGQFIANCPYLVSKYHKYLFNLV